MKKVLLFLFTLAYLQSFAQPRIIAANVVNILAGEPMPNWSLVRIESGKAYKATGTDIDSTAVAIAIDTAFVVDDSIQIAYSGTLQGFDIEAGKNYYLDTAGTWTAIKPLVGFSQKIGQWAGDSTLQLNIQDPIQIVSGGGRPAGDTYVVLSDPFSTSSATPADVGLEFEGEANSVYVIRFYGLCQLGISTSGIGLFIKYGELADESWGEALVFGRVSNNLEPKTTTSSQQVLNNQLAGTSGNNGTGTDGGLSYGMSNAVEGWWVVNTTTAGTIKLRCRSEVDFESVFIFPGAILSYKKLE